MSKIRIKPKKKSGGQEYKLMAMRANKVIKKAVEDQDSEDEDNPIDSMFKRHAKKLKKLKKTGLTDEAYDIEEINSLEALILDLMPIAEDTYRKTRTHTAASAVNHYVATLSSLQADRRALQDLTARADRVTGVFDQSFDSLTQVLITNVQRLQADIAEKGSSKDTGELFKEFLRSMGRELTRIKDRNNDNVMQLMATPKK